MTNQNKEEATTDYKALLEDDCDVSAVAETGPHNKQILFSCKSSSLMLGGMFGFFIQVCTLGMNHLVLTVYGSDFLSKHSLEVSAVWYIVTSLMALGVMGCIRNLVTEVFSGSEDCLEELLLHIECRFVAGMLTAVCLGWTVTYLALGVEMQCAYSLLALALGLTACRAMLWAFSPSESSATNKTRSAELIIV